MNKKTTPSSDQIDLQKRIEELEKRNQILEESLEASQVIPWEYDFRSDQLFLGKAHLIIGFDQEEAITLKQLLDRVHPEDSDILKIHFNKYFDKYPESHEYHYRVQSKSGDYRWISSVGRLVKVNDTPERIVGTLRDITYRKNAEDAFVVSENKFQLIADYAHEGIILHKDGIITDINDTVKRIFGYDIKKYEGKDLEEFFEGLTFEKLECDDIDPEHYECKTKDEVGNAVYIEVFKYTGPNYEGVVFLHNITVRKSAELKLKKQQLELEESLKIKSSEVKSKDRIISSSERTYRALIYNLQGLAYRYVPNSENIDDFKTSFISEGSANLIGYEPAELESESVNITNLIPNKNLADKVWAEIKECLRKKESFHVKYPIKTKSGSTKWVSDRGIGVYENGKLVSLEGVLIDITSEKERELSLIKAREEISNQNTIIQQRQRTFSNLLKNMQGMAYRSNVDRDGNFESQFISEGCFQLTGYTVQEIMSEPQFFENKIVSKDYQNNITQIIIEALNSKSSFEITYPIITKRGEKKWAYERGLGIYNDEGNISGIEGVIVDVTRAKEHEKQYRLAQETIERAPIIIEWLREDGSFHYVNNHAEKISGWSKEEFSKIKIFDIDPTITPTLWNKIFTERHQEDITDFEALYPKKDGTSFPCLISASNIEFEGTVLNCSYIYDISDLKRAQIMLKKANSELSASEEELRLQSEELVTLNENLEIQKEELEKTIYVLKNTRDQLVQAEKMASLGVLVAGIAHELNNPINYISTSAEALNILMEDIQTFLSTYDKIDVNNVKVILEEVEELNQSLPFSDLIKEFQMMLKNINKGAEQATDIVKGLRTFSRMDKEKTELHNIHDSIDNVLLMLHNSYKYRIKIEKNYGDLPPIECAPGQINQVIMNLISNAIQAISNEGLIKITTLSNKNTVSIKVADTGVGISENMKKRIFEPFFTTKEPGEGTGLGLSISLGIVQDHNGSIDIESHRQGATFILTLPIKQQKTEN